MQYVGRDNANGGTREEASIVKKDGTVIRGEAGSDKTTTMNGVTVATTQITNPGGDGNTLIHSHETAVTKTENGSYLMHNARQPGPADPATFKGYDLNVIVGPLGEANIRKDNSGTDIVSKPGTGAVFFNSDSQQILKLSQKAMKKIVGK